MIGVLLMAHGTPSSMEDLAAYYTRIRRGRPPSDEQLADLRRRYDAIGGSSPLAAHSAAQGYGIHCELEALAPGRFSVRGAYKFSEPFIEEEVAAFAKDGVERIVGVALAPHHTDAGNDGYGGRVRAAAAAARIDADVVTSWHLAPALVDAWCQRVVGCIEDLDAQAGAVIILFTAHSLPMRVVGEGHPYPAQVGETAAAVAAAAGIERWIVAFQSAGRTPDPWLGPDLLGEVRRAAKDGARAAIVCPIGFTSDHLEVLYDLDIEAAAVAREVGMDFARTPSLNDDPGLCRAVADAVLLHA